MSDAIDAVRTADTGGFDTAQGSPRAVVPMSRGQLLLMPAEVRVCCGFAGGRSALVRG
jgi:hypothetical protein